MLLNTFAWEIKLPNLKISINLSFIYKNFLDSEIDTLIINDWFKNLSNLQYSNTLFGINSDSWIIY